MKQAIGITVKPEKLDLISKEKIIETIKEALMVFGDDGIKYQVPNTLVQFKF